MYRRYFFKTFDPISQNSPSNNLLNSMFYDSAYSGEYPKINIVSDDEEIRVEATIPGIPKDDILLELEGNILTISVDTGTVAVYEHRETRFSRSVELGPDSDLENISADHSNGILTVRVPKLKDNDGDLRVINIS